MKTTPLSPSSDPRPFSKPRLARHLILSGSIAGVLVTSIHAAPLILNWDPALNGSNSGGNGSWDTSTANWFNGAADQLWPNDGSTADFAGTGGTVALSAAITAGALQFDATGYTIAGPNALTLSSAGGTASGLAYPAITVTGSGTATISATVTGSENFHKLGTGTLVLSGTNFFSNGLTVEAGKVQITTVTSAGSGSISVQNGGIFNSAVNVASQTLATNINLTNGGIFSHTAPQQLNLAAGDTINIGAGGGTIDASGGTGTTGKLLLAAGGLSGSGNLTKTGAADIQLSGANAGYTGSLVTLNGLLEFQNVDALGTGTTSVVMNSGSEFVTSGVLVRHNFTLNTGSILSANSNANGVFSGTLDVEGTTTAALRYFQTPTTANGFTISGPLTGLGTLNVTAPAAATLTLSGSRAGFTGTVSAGTNATVLLNNSATGGTLAVAGGTIKEGLLTPTLGNLGSAGLNATYFNLGSNPGIAATNFAVDQLYLTPRAFSRTDVDIDVPQPGANGTSPILPVLGFATNVATGGINDGILWKGLLNITTAGSYQFSGTNDDNLVLFIDGQQVGTIGVVAGVTNIGAAQNLAAGAHSIVVKQTQGTGGGYATLRYNGPDSSGATQVIPASAYTTGALAPTDLGVLTTNGSGTIDINNPSTATALNLGNGTLTLTSSTIDNLTVAGGNITAATPTLAPTTAGLIVKGAITGTSGLGLNFAGPYFAEFQGANTYNGLTTVTGGQLRLNASGGNSIAGNLTVNAANTNGQIANVRLLQSNQIADTATVTVTQGILDVGAQNDTIGGLVLGSATTNGTILGAGGVLTVGSAPVLNNGVIGTGLGGTFTLAKAGAGTVTLAGSGTYQGVTNVTGGILRVRGANALGAGGAGNETTVSTGATLQFNGSLNPAENVNVTGAGVSESTAHGALRNLGGVSSIGNLVTGGAATVNVDSGELILTGTLDQTAGVLTKIGAGTLTFASPLTSLPTLNFTAGALGFSGPQNFGSATVPAGLAYQFDSDPGAGVSVTVNAGSTVIANYASPQSLLNRLFAASNGTFALTASSSGNLDFTGADVFLGATVPIIYSGVITPNPASSAYKLGGGGGRLNVTSTLAGSNGLQIGGNVQLSGVNTFTGAISVNAGGLLAYVNDTSLGATGNQLTLNGGTLQFVSNSDNTGAVLFGQLGNPLTGGRTVILGAGGGMIDVPARQNNGNSIAFTTPNTLTGSGDLAKTGLGYLFILGAQPYSGALTLASSGGTIDVRGAGSLASVASITLNQSTSLQIDDQNQISSRQFAAQNITNRINDAAPLTFTGGSFTLTSRAATTDLETLGPITTGSAQSAVNANANAGTSAAVLAFGVLTRDPGSTLRFGGTAGTFGAGTAGAPGTANTQVTFAGLPASADLGWGTVYGTDLAAYDASVGIKIATYTTQGAAAFSPAAANNYNLNAAGTATLNAGNQELLGLKFAGGTNAQVLAFTGATDTLFVNSGGVVTDNGAATRAIGAAALRGQITAGSSTGIVSPAELFFHNNSASALTVFSTIVDNNGVPVATVKDLDGLVTFDAANSYTGGTFVDRGTLTVNSASGLGAIGVGNTGLVQVRNSTLNLAAPGAVSGTPTANGAIYTTPNNGEIVLTANTATAASTYNAPTDRFFLSAGSSIYANSPGANFGFNSLTRVASPSDLTGSGQIYLEPGAIIRYNMTNAADQGTGTLAINNLGTDADLFFAPGNLGGVNQTVTVGAGTPYRGLSTDRNALSFTAGTIYANSDFVLQGLQRDGGVVALTLGAAGNTIATGGVGGISIVNNSGGPIRASVVGQVAITEDEPVYLPNNLTFVLTAGSIFQPNTTQALGFGSNQASVLVQAGGVLDPGNYVGLGSAMNQTLNSDGTPNGFQNLPYPTISPVNGKVTVEAGGKFIINDTSGIGSAPVGSWTLKTDSILELGTANAFFGRGTQPLGGPVDTTGLIQAGQFNFEPGVIFRLTADNIYKATQFIPSTGIVEVLGGNRLLTSQNNPFLIPTTGTPTIAPENFTFTAGGILTNDSADRQVSEGRGRLIFDNGSIIAGTSQTYFTIQEGLEVLPNATVTIGSPNTIDGVPKLGAVQLNGPNSNVIPNSANIVIANGAQLAFNAQNVWPDTHPLDLPFAVTSYPATGGTAVQPGNGSSLLLNTANFTEVIGPLTGVGTVLSNAAGTLLATGEGATSDFTFNGVFKNTNGQNPGLVKIGTTKLSLTNASDSTGDFVAEQGTLAITGNGAIKGNLRAMKDAVITIDNSGTALSNRTLNSAVNTYWVPMGGTYNLLGNATTPVTEQTLFLANSAVAFGGFNQVAGVTTLKITPGIATTTFLANTSENFQSAGVLQQRSGTWILSSPTVANAPIAFSSAGQFSIPTGNGSNGLIQIANPGLGGGAASFGQLAGGLILYSAGTSVALSRPDFLGDSNGDGVPEGFMTEDGLTGLAATNTSGTNTLTATATGLAAGMPVTGTGIPANTVIQSVSGSTVTLSQNTTAAVTAFNVVIGGMRLLSASEYGNALRDNQNTGINAKLSGTVSTAGDTRVQTLTLTPGTVVNIAGTAPLNATPSRLVLNDGGLFVQSGGTATINGTATGNQRNFLQSNAGASLFLHTYGDLNLNATVFTDSAVVKTGPGALNVGDSAFDAFRGSLQIDAGTVTLGPNNGLANLRGQTGFTTTDNLFLNGGTLQLAGNSQFFNQLNNNNPLAGEGGTLTSNTAATVTINGGGQFSGTVAGMISLDKQANNTLILTNANPYSGSTLIRSGTLDLRDSGTLTQTSGIEVQNAILQLDNGYLNNVADRIAPAIPLILKGATVNLTGAAGQLASQTFNTVTLAAGLNQITSNAGGSGANELTFSNLIRNGGTGAYLNFGQNYGFVGAAGNTTAIRDYIGQVNGSALSLHNGIIGSWAIVNGSNFATYLPSVGVGAMGNTADGFAAYSSTDVTAAAATNNVNDAATARTLTVSKTINSWRMAPTATAIYTFNSGVGLTIDTGGLLSDANFTVSLSAAADSRGNFITSNSSELGYWVNQNTNGINIPVTGAIDFVKSGPGALNLNAAATLTGTVSSGSDTITLANTTGLAVGQAVSGTGIQAGTTILAINPNASIQLTKPATAGAATFVATFGNSFTGRTFVNGGTLTLNQAAASPASLAIPGDLVVNNATVTEANVSGQLSSTANITITGNGRFNAVSLAGASETIGSVTVMDLSGTAAASQILDRTATQPTSTLTLSASTAITVVNNTNATTVPAIGSFLGILSFVPASGTTSTLNINAPSTVNGLAAVGLRNSAQIGAIPLGVIEGGLIKTGTGLMVLDTGLTNFTGIATGYTGDLSSLQDALNIQQGLVRFDSAGALGTNTANTTVQSGAVLLGSNPANIVETGSITLKDGATLAATINSFTLGVATTTVTSQSVLRIAGGNVNIPAYDYFVPATNVGNITANGRLTGSGTINVVGPQIYVGLGAGGTLTFGNPILSGAGASDFNGVFNVGPNAILKNQVALAGGATRVTGDALGTAVIDLNGGRLSLRDDTSSSADLSSNTVTYGNTVVLNADSYLDANRASSTTAVSNTIALGALTVPTGTKTLTVDSGNTYITRFSELDGPGTLIKGGAGLLTIDSVNAGAVPSFGLAGGVGLTLAPTFNSTTSANVTFTPAAIGLQDFQLNGFYITPASKTFNIAGTFAVNANAGNVSGMLAVTNTTAINANQFINNGQVGATGGAASIGASAGFSGSGLYVTNGQALTLNGNVTGGVFRMAGNNTVLLTGSSLAAPVEVQSGTLQLNPIAPASNTGNIRVFGAPATAATTTTNPVSAVSGNLVFNAGASGITQSGNITNNGLVRASSGTTTITGAIAGTATQYVPGLLEGMVQSGGTVNPFSAAANRVPNPGNFGIRLDPRMAQTNAVTQNALTGWTDGQMWIYTGYIKDDDGVFSLAENIDDSTGIWIDGVNVLNNGTYNVVTTTAYANGLNAAVVTANANAGLPTQNFGPGQTLTVNGQTSSGWHLLEIRVSNGAGGAGPVVANGFANNYGLGYKNGIGSFDGADYVKPVDDGTGNLFVTPVGGKGNIQVDAGASLIASSFSQIGTVTIASGAGSSLEVNGATASDADTLIVSGSASGTLKFSNVVSIGSANLAAGTTLSATGGGSLRVNGVPAPGNTGTLAVSGASLGGSGTLLGTAALTGGTLAPGNDGAGTLTVGNLTADSVSTFSFQIGTGVSDQVVVTGSDLDLGGSTLSLSLLDGLHIGDVLTVVLNQGTDTDFGTFAGLSSGSFINLAGGQQLQISYFDNPGTPTFETAGTPGVDSMTNVSLLVTVPEPTSFASLLAGVGALAGLRRFRRRQGR